MTSPPFKKKGVEALGWLVSARAALLAGVGIRTWFYGLNDSFWRDESKVLLHVIQKPLAGLLGFPEFGPAPLLWLHRLLYLAGANSELSFRAVSLAANIFALYLFYRLAPRVLPERRSALFAIWLLALAPGVILFAALAKPYSVDLLVATALLSLAVPCFVSPPSHHKILGLTLAAIAALWFSHPAIFLVASLGMGLLLSHRTVGLWPLTIFLGTVTFSLALLAFMFSQRLLWIVTTVFSSELTGLGQGIINRLWWLFCQTFYAYLGPQKVSYVLLSPSSYVLTPSLLGLAILIMLGLWEAQRQYGWGWTIVLAGPLTLALAASTLGVYPPFGRLLLFATPGLYLLAGYGASSLFRAGRWPKLVSAGLILLILSCGQASWAAFGRPVGGVREALKFIAAHQQPGDVVFFDPYASSTINYYRMMERPYAKNLRYGFKFEDWSETKVDHRAGHRYIKLKDLLSLAPSGNRVWLVAETLDYARGRATGALPYWQEFEDHLAAKRETIASYTTARVRVRGFSPQEPETSGKEDGQ